MSDNHASVQDVRARPTMWWMPLVVSIAFTPIALFAAFVSAEFGHGDYVWAKILFPQEILVGVFVFRYLLPVVPFAILHYPFYGLLLSIAAKHKRVALMVTIIAVTHALSTFNCLFFTSGVFPEK